MEIPSSRMQMNHILTMLHVDSSNGDGIDSATFMASMVWLLLDWLWRTRVQRNLSQRPLFALLEADVPRLWPASSASATPQAPVWSAFFRHLLFERHVLGIVAGFTGAYIQYSLSSQ